MYRRPSASLVVRFGSMVDEGVWRVGVGVADNCFMVWGICCERSCVNTAHGASHYYQNSLELLLIVVASRAERALACVLI